MLNWKWLLAIFAVALVGGGVAVVHHLHGEGGGHHHGDGEGQLQLDAGRKWKTDAPLRLGMGRIRSLVSAAKPDGSAPEMQSLAKGVQEQVDFLIANCKLTPKADATLHVLIADLLEGADLITKGDPDRGISVMREALDTYPKYFDDAGWSEAGGGTAAP